jgi:hypothetical protein
MKLTPLAFIYDMVIGFDDAPTIGLNLFAHLTDPVLSNDTMIAIGVEAFTIDESELWPPTVMFPTVKSI